MSESEKLLKFIKENGYDKKWDLAKTREEKKKVTAEWQKEYEAL